MLKLRIPIGADAFVFEGDATFAEVAALAREVLAQQQAIQQLDAVAERLKAQANETTESLSQPSTVKE